MRGLSSLTSSTAEVSMASLIYGYLASMATILVVLMVLLNSYLKPSSPTAVQQPPPPVIGRNAAPDHQTEQLTAAPTSSTDGSPSGEVSGTLLTDVEASQPESTPAPVEDSNNAQMPVNAEAAPTIPDNEEIPFAKPAKAEDIKSQKSAGHHRASRHHKRRYHSEGPYDYGWR